MVKSKLYYTISYLLPLPPCPRLQERIRRARERLEQYACNNFSQTRNAFFFANFSTLIFLATLGKLRLKRREDAKFFSLFFLATLGKLRLKRRGDAKFFSLNFLAFTIAIHRPPKACRRRCGTRRCKGKLMNTQI